LPKVSTPVFKKDTFNIINFGAIADGQTLNTKAINKAIVTCSEAGGGTVIVPSGVWLTGSIVMKSNVNLHLRKGALIQFSNRFEDFDLIRTTYEGLTAARCQAPVYGIDLENVAITGFGVLDGAGDAWRPVKRSKMTQGAWEKLIASGGLLSPDKNNWYPTQKSYLGSTVQLRRIERWKRGKRF
jgi:DNA sulfur modification protein DndE